MLLLRMGGFFFSTPNVIQYLSIKRVSPTTSHDDVITLEY